MHAKREVNRDLVVLFNAQVAGDSMGGGDKIVLNLSSAIQKRFSSLIYAGCEEGRQMANKHFNKITYRSIGNFGVYRYGLLLAYILRILTSYKILFKKLSPTACIWSASDFLPDTLPGFIYKLCNKKSFWIANLFLVARNPLLQKDILNINSFFYYVSQRISILLFRLNCDVTAVLNESDRQFLISKGLSRTKVIVISGGIDLKEIEKVKPPRSIKYQACYIGRFHQQKGIDDLFFTWDTVVKHDPKAKLAIIGWGSKHEQEKLQALIHQYHLENNIVLCGFKDGAEKIKILKSSDMLLFPSNFESWGVVIAEGIAAGIPVVSYQLAAIEKNFKAGVLWCREGDRKDFSEKTLLLLHNTKLRKQLKEAGLAFAKNLDWQIGANHFFQSLQKATI